MRRAVCAVVAAACAAVFIGPGTAHAYTAPSGFWAAGEPDPEYGAAGEASHTINSLSSVDAAVVDGGVVTEVGTRTSATGVYRTQVMRFDQSGSPDANFSVDGVAQIGTTSDTGALDVVVPASGGGVVVLIATTKGFRLTQVTDTGAVDSSYGTNGSVSVPLAADIVDGRLLALADGGVLVSGAKDPDPTETTASSPVLVKVTSAGVVDSTFHNVTSAATNDLPTAATYLSNAVELDSGVLAIGCAETENNSASCVIETSSAGAPVTAFGTSGLYTWSTGSNSLTVVATDSSHRLYLTGGTTASGARAERFSSGTTPDSTYGESGVVILGCAGVACSVLQATVDATGSLYVLVTGDDGQHEGDVGVLVADSNGHFSQQCCTYAFDPADGEVPLAFGMNTRDFMVARQGVDGSVQFSVLSTLRALTLARDLPPTNYFGDNASSPSAWTPSTGNWTFVDGAEHLGQQGDIPVPSYYGKDARSHVEEAVWRPSSGGWYEVGLLAAVWGKPGDLPVPGDYNGDGTGDFAVWRGSTGGWYIKGQPLVTFGQQGDIAVPADYNGDGKSDVAVWRPSNQKWYLHDAPDAVWGTPGDVPVPGDYNGDGRTDLAIWRPQTGGWYVQGQPLVHWGVKGDVPVPGDYDGDGATDLAVWRPSTGRWYLEAAPDVILGQPGDVPIGNEVLTTSGTPYLG